MSDSHNDNNRLRISIELGRLLHFEVDSEESDHSGALSFDGMLVRRFLDELTPQWLKVCVHGDYDARVSNEGFCNQKMPRTRLREVVE